MFIGPRGQNINNFLSSLETSLSAISREKKQCFLIGDFNIDLLTSTPNQYVNNFTDLLTSFACTPLILNPTRITQGSATLIDNIFTNNIDNVLRTGILVNDVSDHLSVFAIVNHEKIIFHSLNVLNDLLMMIVLTNLMDYYSLLTGMT